MLSLRSEVIITSTLPSRACWILCCLSFDGALCLGQGTPDASLMGLSMFSVSASLVLTVFVRLAVVEEQDQIHLVLRRVGLVVAMGACY